MEIPAPDSSGSFQHSLERAPTEWPWILPHYYALNVVREPKQVLVGWSASPNGENRPRTAFDSGGSVLETIGYWMGSYRLVSTQEFLSWSDAQSEAKDLFSTIPIRYLMIQGQTTSENPAVRITGDRPSDWHFAEIRDLGVFFCYLITVIRVQGDVERAEQLRRSLSPAWPPTELILNYQRLFRTARSELAALLSDRDKAVLDEAPSAIDRWLKR